jgi:lambda family phage portal protein
MIQKIRKLMGLDAGHEQNPNGHLSRSFSAAKSNRLTMDWQTSQTSIDYDLRWNLQALINRARDLEQNNEYICGFLRMAENNVLGANPFILQMKIYEQDGITHDRLAETLIESAWKDFSKPRVCSISQTLSLRDIYRIGLRSMLRDGALLIRIHRGADLNKYGIALEPVDIDFLDVEYNEELSNGNRIRMSIEFDARNRPVAYWLLGRHPGDYSYTAGQKRHRVPAADIIHLFLQTRPQQARGYPVFASAMTDIKQLAGYKEAEIVAARVAASKMGFFEKTPGENASYTGPNAEQGGKYMDAEPGALEELPAGLKFSQWSPDHPTSQYGDFVKECLRGIATSLGVGYMSFANDAGDANYSSARMAILEEREGYKMLQGFLIQHLCVRIFDDWLFSSLALGAIGTAGGSPLPLSKFDKFNNPHFQGRRWQWVDPQKEAAGYGLALELGLTSASRIIAEQQGADEAEILSEIELTHEQRKRLGLLPAKTANQIAVDTNLEEE